MACKDVVLCSEPLSDTFTQVSLGILPAGNAATLSPTQCAPNSRRTT